MAHRSLVALLLRGFPAIAIAAATLALAGCVNNPTGNTNAADNLNSNSSAPNAAGGSSREAIYAKEPDQYSETITITIDPTVPDQQNKNAKQDKKVEISPLQFDFARRGGDR